MVANYDVTYDCVNNDLDGIIFVWMPRVLGVF